MAYEITAIDKLGKSVKVNIDKYTDYCPLCHANIQPMHLGAYLNGDGNTSHCLQIVYRCPNNECGRVFFAFYEGIRQAGSGFIEHRWYFLKSVRPGNPKPLPVPESIQNLSPAFCRIYQEANAAESLGLSEVCGVGYRKALEFLVKDYVRSNAKKLGVKTKDVIKASLSTCIEKYIADATAKEIATRAAWLGNDETHYYRIWKEHDIEDLKRLLSVMLNVIDTQLISQHYIKKMPRKNPHQ